MIFLEWVPVGIRGLYLNVGDITAMDKFKNFFPFKVNRLILLHLTPSNKKHIKQFNSLCECGYI